MNYKSILVTLIVVAAQLATAQTVYPLYQDCSKNGAHYDVIRDTPTAPTAVEAVDMGLSVLWANMNVGAQKIEEYGDYFAWGETTAKETYDYKNYTLCSKGTAASISKYIAKDSLTTLQGEDDAATAQWGKQWRMPTKEEWAELYDKSKCTIKWVTQGTTKGLLITSIKTKNSIFLPAAGRKIGSKLENKDANGYYWTATLYNTTSYWFSYYTYIGSNPALNGNNDHRSYGMPVRPVFSGEDSVGGGGNLDEQDDPSPGFDSPARK